MTSLSDLELHQELAALRVEPPVGDFAARLRGRLQQAEARRAGVLEPAARVVELCKARPRRRGRSASLVCAVAVVIAGAAAAMEGSLWRFVAPAEPPASEAVAPIPSPTLPGHAARAATALPAPASTEAPEPVAPVAASAPSAAKELRRHERAPLRRATPREIPSQATGAAAEPPRPAAPVRRAVPRLDVEDPSSSRMLNRESGAAPRASRLEAELPRPSEHWGPSRELLRERQRERGSDRVRRPVRDPAALRERGPGELRERGASERERDTDERGESGRERSRRGREDR